MGLGRFFVRDMGVDHLFLRTRHAKFSVVPNSRGLLIMLRGRACVLFLISHVERRAIFAWEGLRKQDGQEIDPAIGPRRCGCSGLHESRCEEVEVARTVDGLRPCRRRGLLYRQRRAFDGSGELSVHAIDKEVIDIRCGR